MQSADRFRSPASRSGTGPAGSAAGSAAGSPAGRSGAVEHAARAVVHAGDVETPYERTGSGPPVIVFGSESADPFWAALTACLAQRFRVIVPEPGGVTRAIAEAPPDAGAPQNAEAPPAFSAWFRAFLDGLGLQSVSIVAAGPFSVPSLGFALLEPERVERLVLAYRDPPDPAVAGHAVPDCLSQAGCPILVLRLADEAAAGGPSVGADGCVPPTVLRFLRQETDGVSG